MKPEDNEILLEWSATYGENSEDIRASMYSPEMMLEFAEFYLKQKVNSISDDEINDNFNLTKEELSTMNITPEIAYKLGIKLGASIEGAKWFKRKLLE